MGIYAGLSGSEFMLGYRLALELYQFAKTNGHWRPNVDEDIR